MTSHHIYKLYSEILVVAGTQFLIRRAAYRKRKIENRSWLQTCFLVLPVTLYERYSSGEMVEKHKAAYQNALPNGTFSHSQRAVLPFVGHIWHLLCLACCFLPSFALPFTNTLPPTEGLRNSPFSIHIPIRRIFVQIVHFICYRRYTSLPVSCLI